MDGKAFDGSGIPPGISVPFFSASDLQAGTDRALESAIDQFPKYSANSIRSDISRFSGGTVIFLGHGLGSEETFQKR